MSEKRINSRLINKHDTEAHWILAENFIPMAGEIIIYDRDENYNYERFKIGDGVTLVNDLPFAIAATPRSDWNQTDETKSDFILNKPENIAYINSTDNENIEIEEASIVDSALSTISSNPVQNRVVTNAINQLSEEKADKEFVVSIFEQLKVLIEAGKTDEVIAVLDEAFLDLAVLA